MVVSIGWMCHGERAIRCHLSVVRSIDTVHLCCYYSELQRFTGTVGRLVVVTSIGV